LVKRHQVDWETVEGVLVPHFDPIGEVIEFSKLADVVPDFFRIGVENVRAIDVFMALRFFRKSREDVAADVIAFLDHVTSVSLERQFPSANCAIQASANDEYFHGQPVLIKCQRISNIRAKNVGLY
jgi:hypothetical protein